MTHQWIQSTLPSALNTGTVGLVSDAGGHKRVPKRFIELITGPIPGDGGGIFLPDLGDIGGVPEFNVPNANKWIMGFPIESYARVGGGLWSVASSVIAMR